MDSCHLFNFLFGTKRATTELSKCFSSMGERASSRPSRSSNRNGAKQQCQDNDEHRQQQQEQPHQRQQPAAPPPSPLKQLQMRIANFASASYAASRRSTSADRIRNTSSGEPITECGTYRATLVQSVADDYELDEQLEVLPTTDATDYTKPGAATAELCDRALTSKQSNDDNERRPLFNRCYDDDDHHHDSKTEQTIFEQMNRTDESVCSYTTQSTIAIKPLQLEQEPLEKKQENYQCDERDQNNNINNTDDKNTSALAGSNKAAKLCKRVVLYDDQALQEDNHRHHQPLVSSAEVYNIVSEFGEARARLRRVSLVSTTPVGHENNIDNKDKNGKLEKGLQEEDKRREAYLEASSACRSLPAPVRATSEILRDKRSVFVQSLVQSIELNGNFQGTNYDEGKQEQQQRRSSGPNSLNNNNLQTSASSSKPILLVKSLPPKTPPKTNKAKYLNIQLGLNKPVKIQQLFHDESFLKKFFNNLEPLDRCKAAQVCRLWRDLLYANHNYWKGLVNVIDCTQLRREHLVDCIISTLQTAKLKQQHRSKPSSTNKDLNDGNHQQISTTTTITNAQQQPPFDIEKKSPNCLQQVSGGLNNNDQGEVYLDIDQEDVWRIQELCNRFTHRSSNQAPLNINRGAQPAAVILDANNNVIISEQPQQTTTATTTSKSSSIPSQISSTLSSVSLSSLLSPLSESNRIDSLKEKLYSSLDNRGFDAICLFGATDDDLEDLVNKMPSGAYKRIIVGRLNNCSISDRGLSLFVTTFNQIEELELSGCNEITNCFELKALTNLTRLIITDCINIADGFAQKLIDIVHQLDELTIQAYHLTDAFLEYLSLNADTTKLKRLELPNCKEITNQSLITIAKHFNQLETLSVSGSTKISDEGVEILAEQSRKLISLDLSWCSRITDASLECIACDLGDTLTDLILDRNIHITDIGLGYLATMSKLTLLHIRWCPRISDIGLESVLAVKSLRYLSIAGLHQVTARSLLCLVELDDFHEIELTNCPAVNGDLLMFLSARLPKCNIIF